MRFLRGWWGGCRIHGPWLRGHVPKMQLPSLGPQWSGLQPANATGGLPATATGKAQGLLTLNGGRMAGTRMRPKLHLPVLRHAFRAYGLMACSTFGRLRCDTPIYSRAARCKPVDSSEAAEAAL